MTSLITGFARLTKNAISIGLGAVLFLFSAAASATAEEAPTIRFGTPTWPGVTVKSEIAEQILQHIGYKTSNINGSPSVILNSLKTGELDIYLGG